MAPGLVASSGIIIGAEQEETEMHKTMGYAIAAAIVGAVLPAVPANAATLIVNVAGAESYGVFGDAGNTVQRFNIGALSRVTAIAYDVTIAAFSPSYLSEAALAFTGSDTARAGVSFTPGIEDEASGTARYTGAVNLVAAGLDIVVGADGVLRLEYFDTLEDPSVSPDARWTAGTVTFTYAEVTAAVPEPATWLMMIAGFAMVGSAARYRRRATRIRYA